MEKKLNSDFQSILGHQILEIPDRNVRQIIHVQALLDLDRAKLSLTLADQEEDQAEFRMEIHSLDIINMIEPPMIIDYRIPNKPPIIVNKNTQAFEKEYLFEFRLKFTSNFKQLASGSKNQSQWTITLFANSDRLRSEWIKNLKKVYQTTLLAMLEDGDADSS